MLPPGGNETLFPSFEATKVFPVWTPSIVSVMLVFESLRLVFGRSSATVAVADIVFVVLMFATVKLAVVVSVELMNTVRLSGDRISG